MARPIPTPGPLAIALVLVLGATGLRAASVAASGQAIGTVQYQGKTITLEHAYLITGERFGNEVRRVILSAVDIEDQITGSSGFATAGAKLREGISFELDDSMPFVGYWMAIADQSIQVSSPLDAKLFATTADTPRRVAGRVSFDDTGSGGPKVEVSFDAALTKAFE